MKRSRVWQGLSRVGGSEVEGSAVGPGARPRAPPATPGPEAGQWLSARSTGSAARGAGTPLQDTWHLGCGGLVWNPDLQPNISTWGSEAGGFPAPEPARPSEPVRP